MSGLLGAAALREVLDRHRITPAKALGQNFVIDPNTIRKMLDVADPQPDDVVLEIGPGAGSLTLGLAARCARVVAVEKDVALLPVLEETLAGLDNVQVVSGDALELDVAGLGATALAANLPYNVAATLVIDALARAPRMRVLTVMTQREVGERLAAQPGGKTYGRTSVMVALFASARVAGKVSSRAFWPVPNVDSVIVRIERNEAPLHEEVEVFRTIVRTCFSTRRKTVRNGLAGLTEGPAVAEDMVRRAGIDPGARPETLSPNEFAALTDAFLQASKAG
jgi:16S rRNA (adenine1518-N6/adenine1519-N6)-dimethyltransferase